MTDKILVVTAPDDILIDGIRILLVDLTEEQNQIVSAALLQSSVPHSIINYIWRAGDPVEWLFDKQLKSNIVIFNADSNYQTIIGYMAAQPKSYYFNILKDLHIVNNRAIYNLYDIINLLENV